MNSNSRSSRSINDNGSKGEKKVSGDLPPEETDSQRQRQGSGVVRALPPKKKSSKKKKKKKSDTKKGEQQKQFQQQPLSSAATTSSATTTMIKNHQNQYNENTTTLPSNANKAQYQARQSGRENRNQTQGGYGNRTAGLQERQRPLSTPGAFRMFLSGSTAARYRDAQAHHNDHNHDTTSWSAEGGPDLDLRIAREETDNQTQQTPVVEAFLQEEEDDENDEENNRNHQNQRNNNNGNNNRRNGRSSPRPPPRPTTQTVTATLIQEEDEKDPSRTNKLCPATPWRIILVASTVAIGIIVAAIVTIVMLRQGNDGGGGESMNDDNNNQPSPAPQSTTTTSSPSASPTVNGNTALTVPLTFGGAGVNILDNYQYLGLASIQYGFDRTDCFSDTTTTTATTSNIVVTLNCPGAGNIVLLNVIGYNAEGMELQLLDANSDVLSCSAESANQISCTYNNVRLRGEKNKSAQTTIFVTACGADQRSDTLVEFDTSRTEMVETACPNNPSFIGHSLAMGYFCDDQQYTFQTGIRECQGATELLETPAFNLDLCGSYANCLHDNNIIDNNNGASSTCSINNNGAIKGQVDVNTGDLCYAFDRNDWGTFAGALISILPQMISALQSKFIIPMYAEDSLDLF